MSKNKFNIPKSNLILLISSIISVIAVLIVFVIYSNHQNASKSNNSSNSNTVIDNTNSTPPQSTPEVVLDVIVPTEGTVKTRFNPPVGFQRMNVTQGSFGDYLLNFKLKEYNTKPLCYNIEKDTLEENASLPAVSVLDLELIQKRNLQISYNSIILLYSNYLYENSRFDDIKFKLSTTPVFQCDFTTWSNGGRLNENENGTQITWCLEHGEHCSHRDVELGTSAASFKYYLQKVMTYSSTASFKSNLYKIQNSDAAPGDVIFYADSSIPSIIVDMALDANGNKIYIMAQGNSPASEIYIVRNEKNADFNPWHNLTDLPIGATIYRF